MKVPLVVFVTIMHIINYLSACSCPTAGACSVQCSKFVYLSGAHNTTRDRNIALEQFRDCKTACFRNSRRTNNCADLEELEDACKCDVGYYLDKTANETCRPHSSCLPGEGVSSPGRLTPVRLSTLDVKEK